ncbi:fungal-specific transcription factor domain-containing protein [Hypoxylon sp. FL1284]|nr:fungal-specific transcription factor domain-containing protein [Hypoxylon sp. FL1284]
MVAPKACHNCRRCRLRCDRSVPGCLKCSNAGRQCLGYGKLYKWIDGVSSQDRTKHLSVSHRPKTPASFRPPQSDAKICSESRLRPKDVKSPSLPLQLLLLDPLLQGLDGSSRYYLNYYSVRFCQDLIIYDSPQRGANPFRDLIPMSRTYPFLRNIIIAASALHYSNAVRRWSSRLRESPRAAVDALVDALRARQRAITSVQGVLERRRNLGSAQTDDGERDALLAAVLFFLNFALIDSGKGGWRAHMNFIGGLLSTEFIQGQSPSPLDWELDDGTSFKLSTFESIVSLPFTCPFTSNQSVSIRDYVVSDSTAYYIWSNALDSLLPPSAWKTSAHRFDGDDTSILDILLRTEAESYHSCPSRLLYIIFRTSQLARDIRSHKSGDLSDQQMQSCLGLIDEIQMFDGDAWAVNVFSKAVAAVGYIDEAELEYRKHIAASFRAAACLYVFLVAPGLSSRALTRLEGDSLPSIPNAADLATTILYHSSFVPADSPLFKFATWPIFLTGVETADPARRTWVLERLRDMRDLCPWGMLTSTMETLVEIWQMRDRTQSSQDHRIDKGSPTRELALSRDMSNNHWLLQLQGFKTDCLIV